MTILGKPFQLAMAMAMYSQVAQLGIVVLAIRVERAGLLHTVQEACNSLEGTEALLATSLCHHSAELGGQWYAVHIHHWAAPPHHHVPYWWILMAQCQCSWHHSAAHDMLADR